jgi:hypothetical protein
MRLSSYAPVVRVSAGTDATVNMKEFAPGRLVQQSSGAALKGWGTRALGFGFADFETRLTEVGGLDGIHARFQVGLFEEVSPSDVPVFGGLALFELLKDGLGAFTAFDDGHNAAGLISAQIVADYSERTFGFSLHSEDPIPEYGFLLLWNVPAPDCG